jgi:chromosome segregation ATPase
MKKLLFFAVLAAMVVSCDQKKQQEKQDAVVQQLRDSLSSIISQKDNELNDMMSTLNDIEDGFRAINEAQGRVALAKQGEGTNTKARIRENMQFIQTTMAQNRELINKLKQQLRESSFKSDELKRAIETLTSQLEEKDKQLQLLRDELEDRDIYIGELGEKIEGLSTDVAQLTEETTQKTETISQQDKQLHTAWFVFGTKKELKEQNILIDGDVLQQNFNKDYFTKIDIRVDKEIKLYSSSAKMLTAHPSSSYTLQRDANKQYILRITDPQQFWSTSKYLVILVK